MAVEAGIENLEQTAVVPAQRDRRQAEFLKIPRLRVGSRAEFMWISREVVKSNVEVVSKDADGKEFSFIRTEFEARDVLRSAVGTVTKAFPSARQRKYPLLHPDTLHFTPDPIEQSTAEGTATVSPQPTMVIPRDMLDDYIITRYQKQGALSRPALPLLETPAA